MRYNKRVLAAVLVCGLLGLLAASGCSDEAAGSSCSIDKDCKKGLVCDGGACEEKTCESKADCGANRACIPDENRCTMAECTFAEDCDQAAGESCQQGLCVEGSSGGCATREDCAATNQVCNLLTQKCVSAPANCSSDNDCVSPQACDTASRTCGGSATVCSTDTQCSANQYCDTTTSACQVGCRDGGCEAGQACDLTSRACVEASECTPSACEADGGKACDSKTGQCVERTGTAGLCGTCTPGSTTECGAPGVDRCTPLGPDGGRCVYSCQEASDCPSGFSCLQLTSSPDKFCAPANGKCQGCLIDGCPDNQICNPGSGDCSEPKATCEECVPGLCAAGSDCAQYQGSAVCLPICNNGSCPTDYTCNTASNACEPTVGSCEAETCPNTAPCTGTTPYLNEQTCVCQACLDSTHCGGNQCTNGSCSTCACPPGTTCSGNQCIPTGGGCTDTDCEAANGAGYKCDFETGSCYSPGACASDADCRVRCGSLGICVCNSETDLTSCRVDETCIGAELFPGFGVFGCFGAGGGVPFP